MLTITAPIFAVANCVTVHSEQLGAQMPVDGIGSISEGWGSSVMTLKGVTIYRRLQSAAW